MGGCASSLTASTGSTKEQRAALGVVDDTSKHKPCLPRQRVTYAQVPGAENVYLTFMKFANLFAWAEDEVTRVRLMSIREYPPNKTTLCLG